MGLGLNLHPESTCAAVTCVEATVARSHVGNLVVCYVVTGKIGQLRMPPLEVAGLSDGLWRHTCFELFVGEVAAAAYCELNFAPSRRWAAYRFDGYRSGKRAAEIAPPHIEVESSQDRYELRVSLDLERLSDLPQSAPCRVGLSAVIEDALGRLSYWALAHPPGKPDFHHSVCFAHELRCG